MLPTALLLFPLAGPAACPAGPPASVEQDVVQRLRRWVKRQQQVRTPYDAAREAELRTVLADLRLAADVVPELGREVDLALVDLAAWDWVPPYERRKPRRVDPVPPSTLGLAELKRSLERGSGESVASFLAGEVLDDEKEDLSRRRVAAEALGLHQRDQALPALLRAARAPDEVLRETAQLSLVGWPSADVHRFLMEGLERERVRYTTLRDHLAQAKGTLGELAREQLRGLVGRLYVSENWRDAARARGLLVGLEPPESVPILLESLSVWVRRAEEGEGSQRIVFEITNELRRISGRSIGPDPARWNGWWTAVREGRVDLPKSDEDDSQVSRGAFFGLRMVTDRVIFVVDRSGSMDSPFGTSGRTRYEEAVEQLVEFLQQSGPATRFTVVLFHDKANRWRTGLTQARRGTLDQARNWLSARKPDGGTRLRHGIRTGLRLGRNDRLDPARVEADTVVVLCDGATEEGPGWVRPWLAKNNGEAQLVFHCVQIGSAGDGTLEALAAGTGGQYLRIDG